jgi:Carbohydrate esterase, sialic acid-specific acetylesterase
MRRWAPGGDLFPRVRQSLMGLAQAGLSPTHILWHQGETDAGLATSTEVYQQAFRQMVEAIRALGIKAPIYVAVASYCYGTSSEQVRAAQRGVIDPALAIFAGPDTDRFIGPQFRYDDCHLTSTGLASVANSWLTAIKQAPR